MAGIHEQVGEFVLLERVAEGGTAELFRAQSNAGGPIVCIKRIRSAFSSDEDAVAALVHEADIASKLRHPNVVRVFGWGEHEGQYYIAMELVHGPDLASVLAHRGPLPPDVVAHLGSSLARALAYIHHRGAHRTEALIHCDVTPHNVLVDGSGAVKLSDFGVAKALGQSGASTLTRERGKAGYLAPEQLEAAVKITSSVDLFALGLVLWQALIGTHPYVERCPPGRSLQQWVPEQLRKNSRRAVSEAAPTAPAGLCAAIDRLLQPLPERTPAAEHVIAALDPHVRATSAADLAERAASTPSDTSAGGAS